ncbi:MAG: hypothetical protein PVH50_06780, partial [Anaerolineae bacterium]
SGESITFDESSADGHIASKHCGATRPRPWTALAGRPVPSSEQDPLVGLLGTPRAARDYG